MTEFNFDTVFDETMQTHNLDTVVILGHLNPDGDAAGSVMSLAHYIPCQLSTIQGVSIPCKNAGARSEKDGRGR